MRIGLSLICLLFFFVPTSLPAGPPAEQENLNRVRQALDGLSIPFETRPLPGGRGYSLLVRAGFDSYAGTFVLALPLDAEFAVDTGLVLAEKVQGHSGPVNIIVAFLGNERGCTIEGPGGVSHQGLEDLLTLVDIPENWVLCYVDIAQRPGGLLIRHGTRGYVAPLELLQPLVSSLRSAGVPWSFRIRHNEIYKLGLVEGHGALSIAWEGEVNAFVLAGTPGGAGVSPYDLAALLLDYAASLDFPLLVVDRHYFFLTVPGGEVFFFAQGIMVALLLGMAGVCFFLFLIYSARYNAVLVFHTRLFFKSIWVFFLLLVLLAVSIMACGLLYSALFRAFGPPPADLPPHAYYTGAGFTMLLAVLVFFLHWPVFSLIRIPKRSQFYGFSSVILVSAGLFTAAFIDFSFVPAFLWAFVFGFFAASLSKPAAVFICVLLTPLFAAGILLNIIETGCVRAAGRFIFPDWGASDSWLAAFQTALFSLPLMLLIKRGIILCRTPRRRHKAKGRLRLAVVGILLALVLAAIFVQVTWKGSVL